MSDLAAVHQKLSDALARYERAAAAYTYGDEEGRERWLAARGEIIDAVRELDVARRAAPAAPECALSGGDCQYRTQPAEPAPPTATPWEIADARAKLAEAQRRNVWHIAVEIAERAEAAERDLKALREKCAKWADVLDDDESKGPGLDWLICEMRAEKDNYDRSTDALDER